jgi:hypothetical protein
MSRVPSDETLPAMWPSATSGARPLPVDVVELGRLTLEVQAKRSPVEPGFSVGHVDVSAGTLGAFVTPGKTLRILSNCHVLADSGAGAIGDPILYPARDDSGRDPADVVAALSRFVELVPGGDFINTVDCALATPLTARIDDLRFAIPGIGTPAGVADAYRGMRITKVGRTTGKTTGRVRDVHFRFAIPYPRLGQVGFTDQVLCTRYSAGGDSGSLVLEEDSRLAVGLHFAGAKNGSVFNPISQVLRKLRVKLVVG